MTTTNFAEFGWRERKIAAELLTASCEQGFPEGFYDSEVQIMMNKYSGNVFFTNSDYQVAMMNGDELEMYHTTPYHGHEGFTDELHDLFIEDGECWNSDDVEYLYNMKIIDDDEFEEWKNSDN